MLLSDVTLRGTRADQPSFLVAPVGALYFVTDEGVLERNAGTAWQSYSSDTGITQLTGDVTAGPGSGSLAALIAANAVTYAKMQAVAAASRLLGRGTAGGTVVREISLGSGLAFAGDVLDTVGGAANPTVAQIIVPHASILTANSVPIEIIPAPGAGKLAIPIAMRTVKQTTAGGYATNPSWSIRYDGLATDLSTAQSIVITSADKRLRNFNITDFNITSPPFNTRIMWRGSADTTSGNAANYIVVQVVYSILTDGP